MIVIPELSGSAVDVAGNARNESGIKGFLPTGGTEMLMAKQSRPAIRTLYGWAISVLRDSGAITECEYHGWIQDRADPHARDRAIEMARQNPPLGFSPDAAAAQVREVLESIGDICPECPED
jgi:hypothetical protein